MQVRDYRPDVDGLRAVAVLSVLLFHAGFSVFSGGYVGVDVFFVISGFLITGIVRKDIETGRFHPARFYLGRARRLVPALIFTCVVSFLVGAWLLPPEQLADFGGQFMTALGFASNIYFWLKTNYFDTEAHFKPLLHTWSLGVEGQFYLFWPFLLIPLVRLKSRWAAPAAIIAIGAASLAASVYYMNVDPSAVFYLTPFRIAEFAAGAVLAWLPRPKSATLLELLTGAGLLLIGYAIFAFNDLTAFPGINSMIPCIGAALVIYAGGTRYVGMALKNGPTVFIGKISYSVYLAHWPIYVYYRTLAGDDISLAGSAFVVAASLALAVFMYYVVEKPFRMSASRQQSTYRFLAGCVALMVLASAPAASAWASGGWIWRLPENVRRQINNDPAANDDFVWKSFNGRKGKFSDPVAGDPDDPGAKKVLVIGDSMSGDFVNMLDAAGVTSKAIVRGLPIGAKCQPVLALEGNFYHDKFEEQYWGACDIGRKAMEVDPRIAEADTIVLAANWRSWAVPFLKATVERLRQGGKKSVVVVLQKSMAHRSQELLMNVPSAVDYKQYRPNEPFKNVPRINAGIRKVLGDSVAILDPLATICDAQLKCRIFDDDGNLIYFDQSHIPPAGARFFGNALLKDGLPPPPAT